jgi:hypothetical protein
MPYDILRRDAHGTLIWLEAVESLQIAKARIFELSQHLPGEYIIFHSATSEIMNKVQFSLEAVLTKADDSTSIELQ